MLFPVSVLTKGQSRAEIGTWWWLLLELKAKPVLVRSVLVFPGFIWWLLRLIKTALLTWIDFWISSLAAHLDT